MPTGSRSWPRSAEAAERAGELAAALASWRRRSPCCRPRAVSTRSSPIGSAGWAAGRKPAQLEGLGDDSPVGPDQTPADPHAPSRWSGGVISGIIGTLALAIWKFKFLAVILFTKGKFLLLGLTKASTFWSMIAAFGVYWTVFGGWFALGFVLSIYIHEMGHVAVLMRYGVKAECAAVPPGNRGRHPAEAGIRRSRGRTPGSASPARSGAWVRRWPVPRSMPCPNGRSGPRWPVGA